jgi:glycosyltransferase involved in cell wall biosynthesis
VGKNGGIPTVAYHEVLALDKMGLLHNLFCHSYSGVPLNSSNNQSVTGYEGKIDKYSMDKYIEDVVDDTDILHSWATVACESARKMKNAGKKVIFTFCDPIADKPLLEERIKWGVDLYREGEWEAWRRFYWSIKYGDYIVANSNFTKNGIVDLGFEEENILVNYHGTEWVDNPPPLPDEFKALFLGSLCLRKGTPYLLEAFNKLPDTKLLMQGEINLELQTATISHKPPKAEWRIFDLNVERAFSESSVYVQPSIVDGCPIPILEAMMRGRPVIATTNCGSGEHIRDGWSGFVIPACDSDAIVTAVQYFIDNPSEIKRMGDNARATAELNTWDKNEEKLQRWYGEL